MQAENGWLASIGQLIGPPNALSNVTLGKAERFAGPPWMRQVKRADHPAADAAGSPNLDAAGSPLLTP
jgi:hypothetical protein